MKVIIAGGRKFNNYALMCQEIEKMNLDITEVVCGGAKGADLLGQKWAEEHGIAVKFMPAEWEIYGRAAGMMRNELMGDYADYLIAFWDGKSKGTLHMINYMEQIGKHGAVIRYEEVEQ